MLELALALLPACDLDLGENEPRDLPLRGFEVLEVTFAYPIDIVAYGPAGLDARIRFEGSFDLVEPGGATKKLDASKASWEELSEVLSLWHDRFESVTVDPDAHLRIGLASGRQIDAGPADEYENWQVTGPGFQLIAMPGGDVAVFPGE